MGNIGAMAGLWRQIQNEMRDAVSEAESKTFLTANQELTASYAGGEPIPPEQGGYVRTYQMKNSTRTTGVVGGGDSAVEEGIYLTRFANSVTIVHRRDELRAQKVLQDRAFANEKVKFIWDSVVEEIKGDDIKVRSVDIKNVKTGEVTNHEFGGVFVYVGLDPVSDYLTGLDITDQDGWVITDDKMATRIPGIFAIGDVRQKDLRQITTAVGDGATAGIEAYNYVTAIVDKKNE